MCLGSSLTRENSELSRERGRIFRGPGHQGLRNNEPFDSRGTERELARVECSDAAFVIPAPAYATVTGMRNLRPRGRAIRETSSTR